LLQLLVVHFICAGTYLWQIHRLQYTQAGQWGYLRVLPTGDQRILPLTGGVGGRTAEASEKDKALDLSMLQELEKWGSGWSLKIREAGVGKVSPTPVFLGWIGMENPLCAISE